MLYQKFIKRLLDILLALIALPFLLVLTVIIAPLIWLNDRGPVFFLSHRRGLNGKIFNMYKFRTMHVNAPDLRNIDNSTYNSDNDPRVTKVGRILRVTSIDELPQIINVLLGDMSWVGPRANLPRDNTNLTDLPPDRKKRLSVRPGITGYTVSLYRNSISSEEKLKHDLYYVENLSFLLDIKIIYWTFLTVFSRKNLYTNE